MNTSISYIIGRGCRQILRFKNTNYLATASFATEVLAKRTNEGNPSNHCTEQISLFYTISQEDKKNIFGLGGLPKSFQENINTFGENCLMVRQPAIEIIECLKRTDYSKPPIRYVLYGKPGSGKSITLAHVLHYAYINKFFIVHVPWVWDWFINNRTEVVNTSEPGIVDLPVISANWLKHFQAQNSDLLLQDAIKTSKEYIWNQREKTPANSSLSELILHGINRVKYAAACVDAIIFELKQSASESKCKVLVAVDGFNALFDKDTNLKTEDKVKVEPNMVSLTHSFLNATRMDWKNGAVIVTVDEKCGSSKPEKSHLPLFLLGKRGFEHLDPWIGVEVKQLSPVEFNSMLDYYEDRRWLQTKGDHLRQELSFLSNNNPRKLMILCASL